jgi:hypothetical protein
LQVSHVVVDAMDPVKTVLEMSAGRWKLLLVAFALFSGLVGCIELRYGIPAIDRGEFGELGITREELFQDGRQVWIIRKIEPWSRIGESGAEVGDRVVPDRWYDFARIKQVGTGVGLTLTKNGESRHVTVPTVARPIGSVFSLLYLLNAVQSAIGIFFGLVLGLRQPERTTSRALALAFVWWSINVYPSFSPPVFWLTLERLAFWVALVPGSYLALWFAVHYPDLKPTGWRALMRRALPAYLFVCISCMALSPLGVFTYRAVVVNALMAVFVWGAGLSTLAALWEGWRHSESVLRKRFLWLLGSFSLGVIPSCISFIGVAMAWKVAQETLVVSSLGALMMYMGLTYAVLRHRVLDLGVAINRSLAFTLVGALLLGSFQGLQFFVGHFLHLDDPAKVGLLTAVLAATVLLAFGRVKPWVERLVDRVFFASWVSRENTLRRFVETTAHFTQLPALCAAFISEVDRFTGNAGCAIYLRTARTRFERIGTSIRDAPVHVEENDPVVLNLRAGHKVVHCDDVHSSLPGQLALPLGARDGHAGLLLLGRRLDGVDLHADEIEALGDAAQRVFADIQTLTIVSLGHELATLQQQVAAHEGDG